jgi:abortive infection bacteriophage resistance protein
MGKEHQPPMSIEEQVKNLKELNLKIEDEAETAIFLNNVSYFRLIKAYSLGLKEKNSSYENDITFDRIKNLYLFNTEFRHLIFPEIEKVEVNLRCRLANYFSCKYGVLGYLNGDNFSNIQYHQRFLEDISREIEHNERSAFVKNFRMNYEGGQLPFYALVELFSFGMLSKFFKNMKNGDKKEIAKIYGESYTYLESWFEHLSCVRNICAHYGRLYNSNIAIKPILYKQYTDRGVSSLRVYASLVCLKHLLPNDEHWKQFIARIALLFADFPCVDMKLMGFPAFWSEFLLRNMADFPTE